MYIHDVITQIVGVVSIPPVAPEGRLVYTRTGPHEWYHIRQGLIHDGGGEGFGDLPSLYDLTPGQTVGLLVTSNGQLHLYLDGRHRKKIASGLPVDTPLWGTADVYGRCTKIKSEILSGELGYILATYVYVCGKEQ